LENIAVPDHVPATLTAVSGSVPPPQAASVAAIAIVPHMVEKLMLDIGTSLCWSAFAGVGAIPSSIAF
jgi:hypothetical protein